MRSSVLCLALVACGRNDAAPPPAPTKTDGEVKIVPLEEIHAPNHDPAAMSDAADQFVAVETEGTMEASLNGVATKLEFLPTGANVAILKPDKNVARVTIGGAPSTKGLPILQLSLNGVRLDQLQLPATITATDDAKAPVRATMTYSITEEKVWRSEPGATVTIESYVGKRVRGKFAGKLVPRSAAFGPPIEVTEGRFDVELRLNGALPGPG